jgi:anthranilate synthase component 2
MNLSRPNILIVDNFDSFTYNLVQIIREDGKCDFDVIRSDKINIAYTAIYDGFLFSPGPGVPSQVSEMSELLRLYQNKKSFLGICLGHQAIAETFGMKLSKLETVRHGLRVLVRIIEPYDYLYKGIPSEFYVGLYHSWGVKFDHEVQNSCSELRITALSNDGIIMGIAHTKYNIRGVQFHPESFMSEYGTLILQNWINNLSAQPH